MPMLERPGGAIWYEITDLTPPWIETPPTILFHLAVTRIRKTLVEALFIACCTFRAFDAREAIQQTLGIPVVTSNQAALAAALRALRLPLPPGTARG